MAEESKKFPASERSREFVKGSIAVDVHLYAGKIGWPKAGMFADYCQRAIDEGINGFGLSIANKDDSFESARQTRDTLLADLTDWLGEVLIVQKADDFAKAASEGALAVFFSAQTSALLDGEPEVTLPKLKAMGLGTLAPVYNLSFPAGDGCMIDDPGPITDYGKRVIEQVHANDIVLDLSHASESTALSAISHSLEVAPDRPVIYSHSSPDAVCPASRNISDAEILACAYTGGVIAINTSPWFLISDTASETKPGDIVNVVKYVRDMVGIDHVALGSDDIFSTGAMWELIRKVGKPDFGDTDRGRKQAELTWNAAQLNLLGTAEAAKIYPALAEALWEADFSESDVRKVLGENALRVFRSVWG